METLIGHFLGGMKKNYFFGEYLGGRAGFDTYTKVISGKKKDISAPNKFMRKLHGAFLLSLEDRINSFEKNEFYPLRKLPSATAFVKESNTLINAKKHKEGQFFYVTDISKAFPSVDLERLAALVIYVYKAGEYSVEFDMRRISTRYQEIFNDSSFQEVLTFLKIFFSGKYGVGLAVGGPASPFLLNLFFECFVDIHLRRLCENNNITYTRYADDLVFSSESIISSSKRVEIRKIISRASLGVNHRKSFVRALSMGPVFITKFGLRFKDDETVVVFPQKKRKKLHAMIYGYLTCQTDWPQKVSGYIAEFLHYYKNVTVKTESDKKTFSLCKAFEEEWSMYRKR